MDIYIDGGFHASSNIGGYGLYHNGFLKGFVCNGGTNQIMEMKALLLALEYIREQKLYGAIIYSDSKYVIDGATSWYKKWKANGFKKLSKKGGTEIKNLELWHELADAAQGLKFLLKWVKGHNGNEFHDKLDEYIQILIRQEERKEKNIENVEYF